MTSKKTYFEEEPSDVTKIKHELLSGYLVAWFPIMNRGGFQEAYYVDAFAGPGRHKTGYLGSPMRTMTMLSEHPYLKKQRSTDLHIVFSEPKKAYFSELDTRLQKAKKDIPAHFKVHSFNADFETLVNSPKYDLLGRMKKVPSLWFIDPFGYSEFTMELLRKIADSCRKPEFFITLICDQLLRAVPQPKLASRLEGLFGSNVWESLKGLDKHTRPRSVGQLFLKELMKHAKMKYGIGFEMWNAQNKLSYHLIFVTRDIKGMEKMKDSMKKVIGREGVFSFHSSWGQMAASEPLDSYLGDEPKYEYLEKAIFEEFKANPSVRVDRVCDFVTTQTPYRKAGVRRTVLPKMVREGKITDVKRLESKSRGFPETAILSFAQKEGQAKTTKKGKAKSRQKGRRRPKGITRI